MLDLSYKLVVWEDIWYAAEIIKPDTHYVTFKVFEIESMGKLPSYKLAEGHGRTEDTTLAQIAISGSIKWDHCINMQFLDQCYHFCGKEQAVRLGSVMERLYDEAEKLLDTTWF